MFLQNSKYSFISVDVIRNEYIEAIGSFLDDFSNVTLRLETTNCCNLKCSFCPHPSHKRKRQFMDDRLFRRIIDQAADIGFGIIDLRNFGEPLLDKRIPVLSSYVRDKSFKNILIHTNGCGLNQAMLDKLAKAGITRIIVSLSPKREFELTRSGAKYDQLVKDLESLCENKDIVQVDFIDSGLSSFRRSNHIREMDDRHRIKTQN